MLALVPLEENSVLEKIGGVRAVNLVVDDFYDRVFQDPVLVPFFYGVDMDLLRNKMKGFLKMALGGAFQYTVKDLRKGHVHLMRIGLSDLHFDRVGEHLDVSLKEKGVSLELRNSIGVIVESCRDAVLNR